MMKYTTYELLTLYKRGWGRPVMVLQTLNPHTLEVEAAGISLWVRGLPALYGDFLAGQWLIVRPGLKGKKSHLNILIYSHLLLVTELCSSQTLWLAKLKCLVLTDLPWHPLLSVSCHLSGITKFLSSCDWLRSLGKMFSRLLRAGPHQSFLAS